MITQHPAGCPCPTCREKRQHQPWCLCGPCRHHRHHPRCGKPLRMWRGDDTRVCGRRAGHNGQCLSEEAIANRARQTKNRLAQRG